MEDDVESNESIARFLRHSSDYKLAQSKPSYAAFMPAANGQTSVYRVSGLPAAEIERLGGAYVEPIRGRLKGFATFAAAVAFSEGLFIEPTRIPHIRHADIIGWSGQRPRDRIKAERLATSATLTVYQGR